ncbi:MAG TPA: type I-E CRISPR-associated protein Cas5/CasD [Flexilinea sp.]|jgi:CRISPR system Cascade subunit CasD|nr:type I-E CRISPR-associated protein Cas5/CasD [Dysgonamonadaceae bacterium]HQJ01711.1 type I-E CRISPR-associated protein Cas5/CasD [Flexilinea sp.]
MDTLLIRLIGPHQAWGVQSVGENRDTGFEPSKSGVIGLLCAALGWPREHPLDDLTSLRMGVRIDQPGHLERDFQTIHKLTENGEEIQNGTSISTRYYLSGAAFLVGLEGKLETLEMLQEALIHPHWLLYLGRKAFPPSVPIFLPDGLRHHESLEDALKNYPFLLQQFPAEKSSQRRLPNKLWLVIEDTNGVEVYRDEPVSFAERHFRTRRIRRTRIENPGSNPIKEI